MPVPYAQETMHGMEYAFGQMLMAYGMLDEGVEVTAGVRDRYDGAKRNPWNEIECGSNYARSMASWGAMVVLAGFTFDAGARPHRLRARRLQDGGAFRSFWSGANAYGTVAIGDGQAHAVASSAATLELDSLGLPLDSGAAERAKLNGKRDRRSSAGDEAVASTGLAPAAGRRARGRRARPRFDGTAGLATL